MLNEDKLIPFHAYNPTGKRALVMAPHPDDESIGCGGALAIHVEAGDPVRVIFLTNGAKGDMSGRFEREDYIRLRQVEARSACACLGITDIAFWPYEDRCLAGAHGALKRLMDTVADFSPDLIYVPSPLEFHPDHRAATVLVWDLSRSIADDFQVMFYEVNQPFRINTLVDITRVLNKKEQAIQIYASQIAERPYDSVCLGLNRFRSLTLSAPCTHAEGFYLATLNQIREVGLYHLPFQQMDVLLPAFPEYGPLVSVIVRTKDRPELLFHALQSITLQTYANIEMVVVNDGGKDVRNVIDSVVSQIPVTYLQNKTSLGRSAAANQGIKAASGTYLNFLDDDDILYPEHIEKLWNLMTAQQADVVYAGVKNAYYNGLPDTPGSRIKEEIMFNRPFDGESLLFENYIPIMSVLFSKNVVSAVGDFSKEMDLYEDWDFWVRVSRQFSFYHLDMVTSEYRFYHSQTVEQSHKDKYRYSEAQALYFERNSKFISGKAWASFFSEGLPNRLKNEIKSYQSSISTLEEEKNAYRSYSEELKAENETRIDYIEQLKAENESRIDYIEQLKAENESRIDYIEQLKAENESRIGYIEQLKAENTSHLCLIDGLEQEKSANMKHIGDLEVKLETSQKTLWYLEKLLFEKEEAYRAICSSLTVKDEQISLLKSGKTSSDQLLQNVTDELQTTRESLNRATFELHQTKTLLIQVSSSEQAFRKWINQSGIFRIHRVFHRVFHPGKSNHDSASGMLMINTKDYHMVQASGLFDSAHYCHYHPEISQLKCDPLEHYLCYGYRTGSSPNPLFDSPYYLQKNPDVQELDIDPFLHFIQYGAKEGRKPHPLFDTPFYCANYRVVIESQVNPLSHYLNIGASKGYNPHPLFDTRFYMNQYGAEVAESGLNPLVHYMKKGAARGCHPHALFDASFYLDQNPDIEKTNENPLLHFLQYGDTECRDPNPMFDIRFYRKQLGDADALRMNSLLHYMKIGAKMGLDPDPLFHTKYYLEKYPDVDESGMNPLWHYLETGCKEGRMPHPFFEGRLCER